MSNGEDLRVTIFDFIFGCRHERHSFPLTIRGRRRPIAASLTGTYVACLDCGKEFPYDWAEMRVLSAKERRKLITRIHSERRV
jgi:hypothetical protein